MPAPAIPATSEVVAVNTDPQPDRAHTLANNNVGFIERHIIAKVTTAQSLSWSNHRIVVTGLALSLFRLQSYRRFFDRYRWKRYAGQRVTTSPIVLLRFLSTQ
jgi:hypothetical protein